MTVSDYDTGDADAVREVPPVIAARRRPRSDHADQLGTFVRADHRGHRLGLLVKIENLLRVRRAEPALHRIFTQNANENAHMVAINDAIGFRPHSVDIAWQLML